MDQDGHDTMPERGRKPVMKRSPVKRNKSMKRRSDKFEQKMKIRRELVRQELEKRPWCEACVEFYEATDGRCGSIPPRRSCDIHEPLTRARGGDFLDRKNTMAVCRLCHQDFESHLKLATEKGWLVPGYKAVMKKIFRRK